MLLSVDIPYTPAKKLQASLDALPEPRYTTVLRTMIRHATTLPRVLSGDSNSFGARRDSQRAPVDYIGWTRLNDVSAPHMLTTVYVKSSGDPVRATDAVMLATRRTILMTISSLCRITRDAAVLGILSSCA